MTVYVDKNKIKQELLNRAEELEQVESFDAVLRTASIYMALLYLELAKPEDVVSKDLYDQVKWERDQAFRTLREHGIDLGERAEPSELYAHWIEVAYPNNKIFLCSNCYQGRGYKTDVCPCCEAIMDEEVE